MLFLISEKVAALYQRFQHAEINFFVGPFAFGKEGGILPVVYGQDRCPTSGPGK